MIPAYGLLPNWTIESHKKFGKVSNKNILYYIWQTEISANIYKYAHLIIFPTFN